MEFDQEIYKGSVEGPIVEPIVSPMLGPTLWDHGVLMAIALTFAQILLY